MKIATSVSVTKRPFAHTIKSFPTIISPLKYWQLIVRHSSSLILSMAGVRYDSTKVLTPAP
jgi:hypothetical protein